MKGTRLPVINNFYSPLKRRKEGSRSSMVKPRSIGLTVVNRRKCRGAIVHMVLKLSECPKHKSFDANFSSSGVLFSEDGLG